MDDGKIVELYLKRDETAIEATEEKYGARLRGFAYSALKDRQAAEEIANDVYLKAWNSIPPNEPKDYLLPYLLRIARQLTLNRIKRQSFDKRSAVLTELTREMEECLPSGYDMESELEARELKKEIDSFLSRLSEEKRNVFVRRYWFFDSIHEIAERLGCRENRVKTMLYRIRADLKSCLNNKGYNV